MVDIKYREKPATFSPHLPLTHRDSGNFLERAFG
jgi:hypothetical protein